MPSGQHKPKSPIDEAEDGRQNQLGGRLGDDADAKDAEDACRSEESVCEGLLVSRVQQ